MYTIYEFLDLDHSHCNEKNLHINDYLIHLSLASWYIVFIFYKTKKTQVVFEYSGENRC